MLVSSSILPIGMNKEFANQTKSSQKDGQAKHDRLKAKDFCLESIKV